RTVLFSASLLLFWYTLVNVRPARLPASAGAAGHDRIDRRLALDTRADLLGRDRDAQAALRVHRRRRHRDRRRHLDGILGGPVRHRPPDRTCQSPPPPTHP